jgi:opacity protein-like surface antigen
VRRQAPLLGLAIAIGAAQAPAQASDPLGFYVGAAIGQATLRADNAVLVGNAVDVTASSSPFSFSKHTTGWKLQLGLRPISLIDGELEYIDFGDVSASFSGGGVHDYLSYNASTSAKAAAAFGVLYLPLPLPLLDLYGKAGLARLEAKTSAGGSFGCLADCPRYLGSFYRDETKGRFAYGAGVQVRVGSFAIRGEYERISANTGDPDLLSLGATWSF